MPSHPSRSFPLITLLLALGCSEVDVDPRGVGGAYGAGGDDGAGAGKHDAAATSTSSGVVDPATICDQFCEATGSCYADCAAVCKSFQAPPCESEGLAYLACAVESFDAATCAAPGCDVLPFFDCYSSQPADCQPETCAGGEASCACTRDCTAGEQKTVCVMLGDDAACTCYVNAVPFATWSGPTKLVSGCSFDAGPCAFLSGAQ